MNAPWPMGGIEWFELGAFFLGAVAVLALLVVTLRMSVWQEQRTLTAAPRNWRALPEIRLLALALPLELLWEIAQFPLYTVWHQNAWSYILYGLAHCTLGDLLILLVLYELIALLNRDRHWYATKVLPNAVLFTTLGVVYTIFSEIMNVRIKGTWGYTELMPLLPVIQVGGMPLLQWALIPPILLWLMRRVSLAPSVS